MTLHGALSVSPLWLVQDLSYVTSKVVIISSAHTGQRRPTLRENHSEEISLYFFHTLWNAESQTGNTQHVHFHLEGDSVCVYREGKGGDYKHLVEAAASFSFRLRLVSRCEYRFYSKRSWPGEISHLAFIELESTLQHAFVSEDKRSGAALLYSRHIVSCSCGYTNRRSHRKWCLGISCKFLSHFKSVT